MPNDCSNYLYLANGKNIFPLLDEYMQDNSPTELDFEKILPMPDTIKESCNFATPKNITKIHNAVGEEKKALERFIELNKMINLKEYGVEGWYQWCVGNWGTKWNAYDGTSNESCVMFCTAWAPPLPIIKRLAELTGETFVLDYLEEGEGFGGRYTAGPEDDNDEYYDDITTAPEDIQEAVGYTCYEYLDEDKEDEEEEE
jgi:hypothetical protein